MPISVKASSSGCSAPCWKRPASIPASTHCTRCAGATTCIYQQAGNLRAAQLLFGHASIESTKEYIGTEQAEALEIARKYHL